jgi:hypothetical protein
MMNQETVNDLLKVGVPYDDYMVQQFKIARAHGYDEPPTMESYAIIEKTKSLWKEMNATSKVDKPAHYQDKNGKDLFQKWYEQHDFNTFRHIMRATAERYTSRYENKNGIEDLEKGIYTLNRLKEYESLEG